MENRRSRIELAYTILSGDDQLDRACNIIPDSFCTNLPINYVMNVVNGAASKLAQQVASAKLVLPWLLSAMGAPAYLVGFLLPLRQAGTLLPQMVISGQMRRFPVRKWFWVVSALVQALMLMLMIAAALTLPPISAGILVVAFLLIFSLARGVGSVSFQDVTGKTIPKGKRGRSQFFSAGNIKENRLTLLNSAFICETHSVSGALSLAFHSAPHACRNYLPAL